MSFTTDMELALLLPASEIPDAATVTKRTGDARYTLKHRLVVYSSDKMTAPLNIEGEFLVGPRGSINQIKPDTLLLWYMSARELYDVLEEDFEGTPQ